LAFRNPAAAQGCSGGPVYGNRRAQGAMNLLHNAAEH
jgi:hypothetical protein